jgi:hypothetical protein
MNQLFDPPAIIRQHKQEASSKVRSAIYSNDEILGKALFTGTNKLKGKDGRTYNYKDENGEYVSSRVSPYSPYIEDNVEPGVFDLVMTLINKGYLTVDSCQGHPDRQFRFVTIAFNTQSQREEFKNSLSKFKPVLRFQEKFKGMGFTIIYDQKKFSGKTLTVQDYNKITYTDEDLVKFLNIMFLRNYSEYHLLMIRIASEPELRDVGLFKYICIKSYYLILYQFRDYITSKLTKHINLHLKDFSDKI